MLQPQFPSALAQCIQDMDRRSQCGFGRIRDLAGLAVKAMASPEAHQGLEVFASVFLTIEQIADDSLNAINAAAEEGGGNHFQDEGRAARGLARRAWLSIQSQPEGG